MKRMHMQENGSYLCLGVPQRQGISEGGQTPLDTAEETKNAGPASQ